MKTFAIADLHGRYDLLLAAIERIEQSSHSGGTVVFKASDIARIAREYDRDLKAEGYGEDHIADVGQMVPQPDNPEIDIPTTETKPVPVAKTKRFWTWITAAALPALGLLDWRVQLASVVIVGGIAGYAIYSMPQVKAKLSKLVEAL